MTKLTLDGHEIVVPPERADYNAIRRKYQALAKDASRRFSEEYANTFHNIDEVHEKCPTVAMSLLRPVIEVAIQDLVARAIYDVNFAEFEEYLSSLSSWDEDFGIIDEQYLKIVLKAEQLDEYRTARRENRGKWIGGGFGIEGAVKGALTAGSMNLAVGAVHGTFNLLAKGVTAAGDSLKKSSLFANPNTKPTLAAAINQLVFNVHFALISAINDKSPGSVKGYVTQDDVNKAQRLLENVTQGRVPPASIKQVLFDVLTLDPYNETFYRYWLQDLGNNTGEIIAVENFFGVSVCSKVLEDQFSARRTALDLSTPESCVKGLPELEAYAASIGYTGFADARQEILARAEILDQERRTFNGTTYATAEAAHAALQRAQDEQSRTVKGVVHATHDDAEVARTKKNVGIGFVIALICFPYITPFFTLRKGYSQRVRGISFAWLVTVLLLLKFA